MRWVLSEVEGGKQEGLWLLRHMSIRRQGQWVSLLHPSALHSMQTQFLCLLASSPVDAAFSLGVRKQWCR